MGFDSFSTTISCPGEMRPSREGVVEERKVRGSLVAAESIAARPTTAIFDGNKSKGSSIGRVRLGRSEEETVWTMFVKAGCDPLIRLRCSGDRDLELSLLASRRDPLETLEGNSSTPSLRGGSS